MVIVIRNWKIKTNNLLGVFGTTLKVKVILQKLLLVVWGKAAATLVPLDTDCIFVTWPNISMTTYTFCNKNIIKRIIIWFPSCPIVETTIVKISFYPWPWHNTCKKNSSLKLCRRKGKSLSNLLVFRHHLVLIRPINIAVRRHLSIKYSIIKKALIRWNGTPLGVCYTNRNINTKNQSKKKILI